jgi:hypothetical protein
MPARTRHFAFDRIEERLDHLTLQRFAGAGAAINTAR